MTQIRYLRLPGGWTLPVALVTETYHVSEPAQGARSESSALPDLEEAALSQVEHSMIAGEILHTESVLDTEDGVYRLSVVCQCHEMIGRRSIGILTEGDTSDDGQNGERGTG